KSLLQLRDWDRQGIAINMALNIDPAELCELNLPDKLSGIVGDLGLEPDRVTVEVTEESFHSNYLAVMEVVARLRMKGFCTSADDFGTGRSNMDTLEALPFSELKIDRSFVSKALTHSFADAGARAAVKLAKSLNLKTVAEGVETTEQFDYVAELGVNIIQGFLFARPLPAEEFEAWYLTNGGFAPAQSPTSEMGLAV
ncbi:MAG: EAL domain-containing protein, partial [bacterium]|nr:EAL domain-containing protein [bacterium]